MKRITKILTANDLGMTGSHQAGICIPRRTEFLSFFPSLDSTVLNPSTLIDFVDHTDTSWTFRLVYYNNKFFGGTRNEYRLTRMTTYLHRCRCNVGNTLTMACPEDGTYHVSVEEAGGDSPHTCSDVLDNLQDTDFVLELNGSKWILSTSNND